MKIDHIALYCKDLERMRQFFIDHFEAVSNELYHNPRTGLRTFILTFSDGGARLELMQRPDTIDADPSKPNIGFIHISIAVGSKDAVDTQTKELLEAGFRVTSGHRIRLSLAKHDLGQLKLKTRRYCKGNSARRKWTGLSSWQ